MFLSEKVISCGFKFMEIYRTAAARRGLRITGKHGRIAVAAGILIVTLFLTRTHTAGPLCLFRLMFRVPCPGCGLTRSLEDVWRADGVLSFRHHPFGLPIFILCWFIVIGELLSAPQVAGGMRFLQRRRVLTGLTAVLLSLWAVRLGLSLAGNTFFLW